LQNLSVAFDTTPGEVEKIPAVSRDPPKTGEWPFTISIAANKEDSAREAENADEEIQVFSDGSAHGGKVGAAAVLIRKDRVRKDRPECILHCHLGPETKHTVHEAELVGMVLALHRISMEKCNSTSCSIAVDIESFHLRYAKPGVKVQDLLKVRRAQVGLRRSSSTRG
jgi:hypothetical protein